MPTKFKNAIVGTLKVNAFQLPVILLKGDMLRSLSPQGVIFQLVLPIRNLKSFLKILHYSNVWRHQGHIYVRLSSSFSMFWSNRTLRRSRLYWLLYWLNIWLLFYESLKGPLSSWSYWCIGAESSKWKNSSKLLLESFPARFVVVNFSKFHEKDSTPPALTASELLHLLTSRNSAY